VYPFLNGAEANPPKDLAVPLLDEAVFIAYPCDFIDTRHQNNTSELGKANSGTVAMVLRPDAEWMFGLFLGSSEILIFIASSQIDHHISVVMHMKLLMPSCRPHRLSPVILQSIQ